MVFFVIYAFTGAIYVQATGTSSEVNNASIAFVDEDGSALSKELINAFYPPRFQTPELISASEVETAMDKGRFMFVVVFRRGSKPTCARAASRHPAEHRCDRDAAGLDRRRLHQEYHQRSHLQLFPAHRRLGATADRSGHSQIVQSERSIVLVLERRRHHQSDDAVDGRSHRAAVIREREHGTLEHLLVMPLTSFEIAMAKVWANSLVILVATGASLYLIVMQGAEGSVRGVGHAVVFRRRALFVFRYGAGIFLGTISRSMAQFALLIILVNVILQLLSGGSTPIESQPDGCNI